jgi:hypothetical protein
MKEIIGSTDGAGKSDKDTLFGLLSESILTLDPGFQTLLRCCAIVCEIGITI